MATGMTRAMKDSLDRVAEKALKKATDDTCKRAKRLGDIYTDHDRDALIAAQESIKFPDYMHDLIEEETVPGVTTRIQMYEPQVVVKVDGSPLLNVGVATYKDYYMDRVTVELVPLDGYEIVVRKIEPPSPVAQRAGEVRDINAAIKKARKRRRL